jgi:hypothetical protein
MVKIGRCSSCGTYIQEIWKERENCGKCGGAVDHIEVDMGALTYVPRALNIIGLIVMIIGIVLLIAAPAGRDGGGGSLATLVLVISAILIFIISLIGQLLIFRKAVEKRSTIQIQKRRTASRSEDGKYDGSRGRKISRR